MLRYVTLNAARRREKLTIAVAGFAVAKDATRRMKRVSVVKEAIGKRV